ncbi:MAG: 50S ribosomal protein L24 [Patescibacteria group bacterium]|jgi:large subunit ribosomal protein L24|nr:50S ribosomal protein L24 [Patescibacteria group bacterium]
MNIKKNDTVKMLGGKDRGKSGKVLQVLPKDHRLSVEGLNLLVKHMRPNRDGEKGQRIEFPAFVEASNVALICPSCNRQTRVGYKVVSGEKGSKKYRFCKKCQAVIE